MFKELVMSLAIVAVAVAILFAIPEIKSDAAMDSLERNSDKINYVDDLGDIWYNDPIIATGLYISEVADSVDSIQIECNCGEVFLDQKYIKWTKENYSHCVCE